jgi:hypothetical protein
MVSVMRYFCKCAQVALKTCTNITATIPLEVTNEVTSCLNCIPVANSCSQTPAKDKYFYVIFLSFR